MMGQKSYGFNFGGNEMVRPPFLTELLTFNLRILVFKCAIFIYHNASV